MSDESNSGFLLNGKILHEIQKLVGQWIQIHSPCKFANTFVPYAELSFLLMLTLVKCLKQPILIRIFYAAPLIVYYRFK